MRDGRLVLSLTESFSRTSEGSHRLWATISGPTARAQVAMPTMTGIAMTVTITVSTGRLRGCCTRSRS
jgi:hypothetical protein